MKRLAQRIGRCMTRDRAPLLARWRAWHRQHPEQPPDPALEEAIARSLAIRAQREASFPARDYPAFLPVAEQREAIQQAIRAHPVVIVCGETGSGKTTQLPKICLDLGLGAAGMIGVTQPRRIAARAIAEFLRNDLHTGESRLVGHKIRFNDHTSPDTLIKVMTDGILLTELQGDPLLTRYEALLVDEAHERSLNIDFLLGALRRIGERRRELKIIISSATLDAEKFSRHFGNAPIIEVSGRTYPVQTRYRPILVETEEESEREEAEETSLESAIVEAVNELSLPGMHGDILIFLPSEHLIREIGERLRNEVGPGTEILPLFARLSGSEQQRIFQPGVPRRIILATNVAETSITVPRVHYVIDSGLVRISRVSDRMRVQRLPVEKCSRAAADQRQGRCGRLADGICIRLYSEEDYQARPRFTDPEILRTSLDAVILQMKAMRLGEIDQFPFVDPPTPQAIRHGTRFLEELGALSLEGRITDVGKKLARLPLPPRLGRILLEGGSQSRLSEILVLVAAMTIPDPREEPLERRETARQAHARFKDGHSDFIGLLNLWAFVQQGRIDHPTGNGFRRFLKENYLSRARVREWLEIHEQLLEMAQEMGMRPNEVPSGYEEIHRALLPGLLGNAGCKSELKEFLGARDSRFAIHPGSALHRKPPAWIIAGELVETSRLYARLCARIEPEWLEAAAGPLCRRSYAHAAWDRQAGQVTARERVTLFGLPLILDRKVHYGPINPAESRRIFIQAALVEGEFNSSALFFVHNQGMIAEVRELEHKSRRRNLLTDDGVRFAFYDAVVPEHIHSARHFHEWYSRARKQDPRILHFTWEQVMRDADGGVSGEQFPGHLLIDGHELALEYTFDPGGNNDGVNARIPMPILNRLTPQPFEWLVPGMLGDRILAMLKSLPKTLRRPLVPLPQTVEWCQGNLTFRQGSLKLALIKLLKAKTGLEFPLDSMPESALDDHLRMNFLVIDEVTDRVLGRGRDLEALKSTLGQDARERFRKVASGAWERKGMLRWECGSLPERVALDADGRTLYATPVLQDDGMTVSLRLQDDPDLALETHRRGVNRLFMLQLPGMIQLIKRKCVFSREENLLFLSLCLNKGDPPLSLAEQLLQRATANRFLPPDQEPVRDDATFQARLQAGRGGLVAEAEALFAQTRRILETYGQIHRILIRTQQPPTLQGALQDVNEQLSHLLPPEFLLATPDPWLGHLPRFLQAIRLRLDRCARDPLKDTRKTAELRPFLLEYRQRAQRHARERLIDPELTLLRWMLEEFRVSQFAQELKTSLPVSPQRLAAQLQRAL
ncbi:MAG: ATP-dependent RNA helicase HrpA [Magnetococcales bacterium]|nr:ATP-dependent RNA helicase HrpA [Magnetococcales bacterium]